MGQNKISLAAALCLAAAFFASSAFAQSSKEEVLSNLNQTGGVYFAYPEPTEESTPAPKGYKPFYVSHYGRHGSRYLISDNDYRQVSELLRAASEAGALTDLGRDVLSRIDSLLIETDKRGGDLSPLGVRQHRGIAERMMKHYPEVFKGDVKISARSTLVPRCILSMDAFCERLKEGNPKLDITRESSNRYMDYLCYHSPESNAYTSKEWKEQYRKFEERHVDGRRLAQSLFSSPEFIEKQVNPNELIWGIYWIASDMQNCETNLDFYDLLTPDELFGLWQCFNYRFYACDGNYAGNGGMPVANAGNLLRNIIDSADEAIASEKPSATLRFGHDGNLIPLAALMEIEGCSSSVSDPEEFYMAFSDYKVSPMAGNIQLIFFRNNANDVIVKVLHNEREKHLPIATDIYPYYRWTDVKGFFEKKYSDSDKLVTLRPKK